MGIVRVSKPVRKSFGIDKNGHRVTRLVASYRCTCGVKFEMLIAKERSRLSCGCLTRKRASERLKTKSIRQTHGMSKKSKTYASWSAMKSRCQNPNRSHYENYGGRGIRVCSRWQSFESFFADMGECPPGHTLERIDRNANYCLENCRWVTRKEQANNTRRNVCVTIDGQSMTLSQWSRRPGAAKYKTIWGRIKNGIPPKQAVFG